MCKALIVCALLFVSAPRPAAGAAPRPVAAPAEGRETASLPFDAANNLVVVAATLNGKGPFRFLLDTGASHHVLKPEVARSLGLKLEGAGEIDGGGGPNVEAALARVAEVSVGGLTLEGQQFFVTPFPALYPFDGFLGAEFFRRFAVRVDFRRSLVTLTRAEAFGYSGKGVGLPVRFEGGSIPRVRAEVDGVAGWFKFDTGYNGELALFADFAERHGLPAKYAPRKGGPGGQTLAGEVGDSPVARVRTLGLGALAAEDVTAAFFPGKGGSNSAFAGAIGTALLKRFDFTIDFKRRRVIIERP
ncbi:MAG TPA: retroviral-like aspartic protease family protein [Pyrinomonadaceae bacterium]